MLFGICLALALGLLVALAVTGPRHRSRYVTAADDPGNGRLVIAAAVEGVDTDARTIAGLIVPFGPAGNTSGGRLTFKAGSLAVADPRRVKLLREHDQRDVVGYATELRETDAGMVGVFHVPEGENGDRALAEAALGLRDAFSVGVQLDDTTLTRLRRSQGAPVEARGQLRETSLVSVPAFDDARVAAAAGADLVLSSWSPPAPDPTTTPSTTPTTAGAAGPTPRGSTMTEEQRARLAALRAQDTLTQAEAAELSQLAAVEADTQAAGDSAAGTGAPATASTGSTTPPAGPAVVPAVAGAAHVTGEPSPYTFGADSDHSIVTDLLRANLRGDGESAERVERFNAQLRDGNPAALASFIRAAATTDDYDGAGTPLPSAFNPEQFRPDLMRRLADVRRPFVSRMPHVPIKNAQPFTIPKVGEYEGIGDHTEGTPHRPAGYLTLDGGTTVQPRAVSGAYEVSRELIDQSNPAIDGIAARAMLRDYSRKSEGKALALIDLLADDPDAFRYGVSDTLAVRGALIDFVNDDEEPADLVVVGKALFKELGLDVDDVSRPQLPYVAPANTTGTMRAGHTGFSIDGHEIARSARLDTSVASANVAGNVGVIARRDGLLWAESAVQQFRFDQVLGPGVVKLALWAYNGAAIIDTADVAILASGVDPTP